MVREGYVYDHEWTKANARCPFHIEKVARKIELFDKLAEGTPFKVPNSDELNFGDQRIDYEFEPKIIEWEEICDRWEDLLYDLSHWSLSYTSIAPYIEPWSMSANPQKSVKETQDITPGTFKQHERLFLKYFGISFLDIFKHETFQWHVKNKSIGDSQEYTEFLIEKVYPECNPFNHLPSETIREREAFFKDKRE